MEGFSYPFLTFIIQNLGIPGLLIVFMFWTYRQADKEKDLRRQEMEERADSIRLVLTQYKEDISSIRRLYENNAHLVEDYEKTVQRHERLFSEVLSVVSLNTQTQTQLVDAIRSNSFCPVARMEGKTGP